MTEQTDFFESLMNGAKDSNESLVKRALADMVQSKSLREKMARGTSCPCCGQKMKIYKYTITGEMARVLMFLYRLFSEYPNCQPVHLESVLRKAFGTRMPRGNKYSLLRHWGLIVRSEKRYSVHLKKEVDGCYSITEKGMRFASGEMQIPKWIYIYDNVCLGVDAEELIDIQNALGKKFTWADFISEDIDFASIMPTGTINAEK